MISNHKVLREKCELCGAIYTAYNNRQTNLMDNCVKCDRKFCEDCRHVEETTDDPWCNECALGPEEGGGGGASS